MKKIKCLIVEDEELARDLLEKFIEKLPHLELVGKCEDPNKAMEIFQTQAIDLLFLDIQMPKLTGIEFLKILPNKPVVIFTTAYAEYALEGYELDITDYLLKPFSFDRFVQGVNKAVELIELKDKALHVGSGNNDPIVTEIKRDYLLVKSEHKIFKIQFSDILYIEGMREYVAFHTLSQGRILSLMSLKKLAEVLPEDQFMRIHKSYIIDIQKVKVLEGNMVHLGDKKIPIGASYREVVMEKVFK